jgi:hypothetical protein
MFLEISRVPWNYGTRILEEAGINIRSLTVAKTADF